MKILRDTKCNIKECPIYKKNKGKNALTTELNINNNTNNIHTIFIGDIPNKDEEYRRIPFCSKYGILKKVINHIYKTNNGILYTNIVKCNTYHLGNNKEKRKKTIKYCCENHIYNLIEEYNPKVIVLLGYNVTKTILDINDIKKNRGNIITKKIGDKHYNFLTTWWQTPNKMEKNVTYLNNFIKDIQAAYDISKDKFIKNKYPEDIKYKLLKTVKEVKDYINHLLYKTKAKYVGFDIETLNLNKKYGNKLLTLQFAENTKEGVVIPLAHRESPFTGKEQKIIKKLLKKLFTEKPKFKYWIVHGGRFEQQIIRSIILGKTFHNAYTIDTLIGMYVLDENRSKGGGGYSLERVTKEFLNFDYGKLKQMRSNINKYPLDMVAHYGAIDACKTLALFKVEKEIAKREGYFKKWFKLLKYVYSDAISTYATLEVNGFYAELPEARLLSSKINSPILKEMDNIKKELYSMKSIKKANKLLIDSNNIKVKAMFGSPHVFKLDKKDHQLLLFKDILNLDLEKTEKGNYSIGKNFLTKYRNEVKEVMLLDKYTKLKKLYTTYAPSIYKFINPKEGKIDNYKDSRVRPSFWLTGTQTGRTSSSDPNLQQVPSPTTEVRKRIKNIYRADQPIKVKRLFAQKKKCSLKDNPNCLVQLDYMTNEVRWWGLFSKDKNLNKVFNTGKKLRNAYIKNNSEELKKRAELEGDIHRQTASRMFNIPIEKVTKEQRQPSKSIIFGWMFGRSNKSIAHQLKPSQWDEKKESENEFFERVNGYCDSFGNMYPKARKWLTAIEDYTYRHGYLYSLIGRRRVLLPYFIAGNEQMIAAGKRRARNSPIQSNASDAAIIGTSIMQKYIDKHNKSWLLQNAVHDSCVAQVPVKELPTYLKVAKKAFTEWTMKYMEKHWNIDFVCPLEVDFEISQAPIHGWATLTKWDFSKQSLKQIMRGCIDPNKAIGKK